MNLAKKMVLVRIDNTTKRSPEAEKYGVGGLPTILFLNARGNRLHEIQGYVPVDRFVQEMQTALQKARK